MTKRPPIGDIKFIIENELVLAVNPQGYLNRKDQFTVETVNDLCDYALELEEQLKNVTRDKDVLQIYAISLESKIALKEST